MNLLSASPLSLPLPMFVADELSGEYEKAISRIPSDTDVLITHQPPYGILDFTDGVHYGNISLLGRVLSIKPRLHLFGHVHKANGKVEAQDALYVNGCIVSGMKIVYKPQRLVIN